MLENPIKIHVGRGVGVGYCINVKDHLLHVMYGYHILDEVLDDFVEDGGDDVNNSQQQIL